MTTMKRESERVRSSRPSTIWRLGLVLCLALSGAACDGCDGGEGEDGGSTCPSGTEGCPCRTGDACDTGLTCQSGVCETEATIGGLSVNNDQVRSCDLVLDTGGAAVTNVAFDDSVIGRFRLDGQRIGVAFTAQADQALGAVAELQGPGGDVDMSSIVASTVTCYDRLGAAVAEPGVRLR